VIFALLSPGRPRRNEPDVFAPIRVNHHQQTPTGVSAEGYKTLLGRVGLVVGNRDGVGILKHQGSIRETNAVFLEVPLGFLRIPDHRHAL
jgi:hypothetical protein